MSLIHEALKKAEQEKKPFEIGKPAPINPIIGDKKKLSLQRLLLYGILLVVSIGLLLYLRLFKKPAAGPYPEPKGGVATVPKDLSKQPPSLKEKGIQLFEEGKWRESLALWDDLSLQQPIDPEIYNNIGIIYKKLGKNKEAYQSYEKALALHKDYPEAHNNLGVLLLEENRIQQAKEHLQNAILLKPDYADPYFNYALILEREGNFKEAKRNYEKFLQYASNIERTLKEKIEKKMQQLER